MVKTLPSNSGGAGLIPGWGAKIPLVFEAKNQNIKQKHCNKFNKDFFKTAHIKNLEENENVFTINMFALK